MHSKGNQGQNTKTAYWTGENICKWYYQKGTGEYSKHTNSSYNSTSKKQKPD